MENIKNDSLYHEKNKINREVTREITITRMKARSSYIYFVISVLSTVAILNLYSVSYAASIYRYMSYFCLGFFSLFIFSNLNYKILKNPSVRRFIFLSSLALLIFMFLGGMIFPSIVLTVNGASSWLNLGFISLQPAELLKIIFIVLISYMLGEGEAKNFSLGKRLTHTTIVTLSFCALILLQNDLGTVIHYVAICMFMIFLSGLDKKLIIKLSSAVFTGGTLACFAIYNLDGISGKGYKYRRINMWLEGLFGNGYEGNLDIGYQVNQSLLAFGNGGLFGVGYGNGVQKYDYLPEIHTDFIMALFGEEMGFLGLIIVLFLFFFLYILIMRVSLNTRDKFGKFLALGIGGLILTQVLINIFVAVGLLPVLGIPMPIFSYGGSSILTILTSIGIVLNINKNTLREFDKS